MSRFQSHTPSRDAKFFRGCSVDLKTIKFEWVYIPLLKDLLKDKFGQSGGNPYQTFEIRITQLAGIPIH